MNFVEGGDIVVPFEECGGGSAALDGAIVEVPDGIEDWVVVGVQDVLFEFGVACDVDLGDAISRDGVDVGARVEAVILRRDVDVVDVEEDAAVGFFDDFVEEFPFGHFGDVELGVTGDVFDDDGDLEEVLNVADALGCVVDGLPGVGHGEQVVGVAAIDGAPAEMVGEPGGVCAADESLAFSSV